MDSKRSKKQAEKVDCRCMEEKLSHMDSCTPHSRCAGGLSSASGLSARPERMRSTGVEAPVSSQHFRPGVSPDAEEFEAVFQAMPDLFIRFSADGTYQALLADRSSNLYLNIEEALGKRVVDASTRLGQQFQQAIEQVLQTRSLVVFEYPMFIDGEMRFFEGRFFPLLDDQVVMVARNITERRQAEERLRYLSFHDMMTGLYNRSFFEEEFNRFDVKRQLPLSIIIGDIDGLKLVNDTLGHQEGDSLIVAGAEIMKASCRTEDLVCRWGGDEFAILLPITDNGDAKKICDRITSACAKTGADLLPVSISLGVATKSCQDQEIEDVLRSAEDMMYWNKLNSNNTRFSFDIYFQRTLAGRTQETLEHARRIQDPAYMMSEMPA
ncbi:MAG: GGDEF domain-containing protein [Thermacetogeniaceae bacterium]